MDYQIKFEQIKIKIFSADFAHLKVFRSHALKVLHGMYFAVKNLTSQT